MERIIFICTGNTCRSPLAEGILNKLAIDNGLDIMATSAGLWAAEGMRVSDNSVIAAEKYDVDISQHLSKPLSLEDMLDSDLILTMTEGHKLQLSNALEGNAYSDELRDRIFTLKEYVDPDRDIDISDPFGRDIDTYIQTAEEIYTEIDTLVKKIIEKNK